MPTKEEQNKLIKVKFKIQEFKESGKFYQELWKEVNVKDDQNYYEFTEEVRKLKENSNSSFDWLIGIDSNWFENKNTGSVSYPAIIK